MSQESSWKTALGPYGVLALVCFTSIVVLIGFLHAADRGEADAYINLDTPHELATIEGAYTSYLFSTKRKQEAAERDFHKSTVGSVAAYRSSAFSGFYLDAVRAASILERYPELDTPTRQHAVQVTAAIEAFTGWEDRWDYIAFAQIEDEELRKQVQSEMTEYARDHLARRTSYDLVDIEFIETGLYDTDDPRWEKVLHRYYSSMYEREDRGVQACLYTAMFAKKMELSDRYADEWVNKGIKPFLDSDADVGELADYMREAINLGFTFTADVTLFTALINDGHFRIASILAYYWGDDERFQKSMLYRAVAHEAQGKHRYTVDMKEGRVYRSAVTFDL